MTSSSRAYMCACRQSDEWCVVASHGGAAGEELGKFKDRACIFYDVIGSCIQVLRYLLHSSVPAGGASVAMRQIKSSEKRRIFAIVTSSWFWPLLFLLRAIWNVCMRSSLAWSRQRFNNANEASDGRWAHSGRSTEILISSHGSLLYWLWRFAGMIIPVCFDVRTANTSS